VTVTVRRKLHIPARPGHANDNQADAGPRPTAGDEGQLGRLGVHEKRGKGGTEAAGGGGQFHNPSFAA
jgi:hypothetical protein